MASFDAALPYLMESEGGYSNHPADKGGATNWGITEAVARAHGFQADMRELPQGLAAEWYKADYWRFDGVTSQAVATKLLDMSANFGLGGAVQIVQRAVNDLVDPAVDVDGGWGPDTLDAINTADPAALLAAISNRQAERYRQIVAQDSTQAVFLNGWLARAMRNPAITGGVSMALLVMVGLGAWMLWGRK